MGTIRSWKLGAVLALVVLAAGGVALTASASTLRPAASMGGALAGEDAQEGPASEAKGWIGIAIAQLNERLAQRLGLAQTSGVVILRVVDGGPAGQAGLKAKDIITQIGGTDVSDVKAAQQAIAAVAPGTTVEITVLRAGEATPLTATVTTATRPQGPQRPKPPKGFGPRPGPLGVLPFRLEELEGIPAAQLFSHFQSAQYTLTDKDGNPVTVTVTGGTVTQAGSTSLTIQRNGANAGTSTYTVTGDTRVLGRGDGAGLTAGDKVMVVTVGTSSDARLVVRVPDLPPRPDAAPGQPQSFRPNFRFEHFRSGEVLPGLRERVQPFDGRSAAVPAPANGL